MLELGAQATGFTDGRLIMQVLAVNCGEGALDLKFICRGQKIGYGK